MKPLGGFVLVGRWEERGEGIVLAVPVETGGGVYARRFSLELPKGVLKRMEADWLFPAHLLVEGELLPRRDSLALAPKRITLLRGTAKSVNEAWGTFFVRERLAESVYLASSSPEEEETLFPLEVKAPLVPGRYYHLKGHLSPRVYERTGIFQVRLKASEALEGLDFLLAG